MFRPAAELDIDVFLSAAPPVVVPVSAAVVVVVLPSAPALPLLVVAVA